MIPLSKPIENSPFVLKQCVLCEDQEKIVDLYPCTFEIGDLNADVFSARRHTEHYHYKMVRCEGCGMIFSREILNDDMLLSLYGESDVTFGAYDDVLRRDYWKPIRKFVAANKIASALEIGCSYGFFLDELVKHGLARVRGCEPSIRAAEQAPKSVRDSIHVGFFEGKSTFPNETFNLVASFHTFDHLSDPVKILKAASEVLTPGGLLYLITHDTNALQARMLGEKSPIIDVEHIYLFNKKNIAELVEKHGYEVCEVGNLWNSYPLRYWLGMFPARGIFRKLLLSLGASVLGKITVPLPAGNQYLIARKRC